MTIEPTKLVLTYPDRATALLVAQALATVAREAAGEEPPEGGWPELTEFPPDGWLGDVYYNIREIGEVRTPAEFDAEGNIVSGHEIVPGWHLLGWWRGPFESVPDPVRLAHVERPDWWPR